MRKLSLVVVCVLCVTTLGCADSHEKATEDMLASMREMNDLLDGVKDQASADAAKAELESKAKQMKAIGERMKTLGETTKEQQKALKDQYGKALAEEGSRLMNNMMRIQSSPDTARELHEILQKAI